MENKKIMSILNIKSTDILEHVCSLYNKICIMLFCIVKNYFTFPHKTLTKR